MTASVSIPNTYHCPTIAALAGSTDWGTQTESRENETLKLILRDKTQVELETAVASYVDADAWVVANAKRELKNTDSAMARMSEDIWEVLKAKGIVEDADLPNIPKQRVEARRNARGKLHGND
jgi:hypothetical protein